MNTWPIVPISEALVERREIPSIEEIVSRRVGIVSKITFETGTISLRSEPETKTGMILARPGDLLISGINAAKGAIAIWPEEEQRPIAATIHYGAYNPRRDRVDVKYLWWFFRSKIFQDILGENLPGGIKTELKPKRLLPIPIPLPPLTEQRRILARIEELAALIHEARGLRTEAADEGPVVMAGAIDRIFSQIRANFPNRTFGSFDPHVTSGPRNWARHYESSGARFYRAQDIGPKGEIFSDSKVFITPPDGGQGRSAFLQPGDLMLVITGATVGRVTRFRAELEPGFVSQHVAICRLPKEDVDPDYAVWGLRGPKGQEQLSGQQYGQGKPGLNLTNIRNLMLPFPPIAEQRRIVAELNALQTQADALQKLQNETAAELDALLPSILDKAFKGEL